jgi:peroxiredoxin
MLSYYLLVPGAGFTAKHHSLVINGGPGMIQQQYHRCCVMVAWLQTAQLNSRYVQMFQKNGYVCSKKLLSLVQMGHQKLVSPFKSKNYSMVINGGHGMIWQQKM